MPGLLTPQRAAVPEQSTTNKKQSKRLNSGKDTYDIISSKINIAILNAYDETAKAMKSGNIAEVMADILYENMHKLSIALESQGKLIPARIMVAAGIDAARTLSSIAQKEGVIEKSQEKQITEDALYNAISMYAEKSNMSPEQAQEYMQVIQSMEGGQNKGEENVSAG
jgi:hypothetical protein